MFIIPRNRNSKIKAEQWIYIYIYIYKYMWRRDMQDIKKEGVREKS